MKIMRIITCFLCLSVGLLGCGMQKEYVNTTKLIEVRAPEYLLAPTQIPSLEGNTNADLLRLILDYKEALHKCNADKEAVREL